MPEKYPSPLDGVVPDANPVTDLQSYGAGWKETNHYEVW